MANRKILYGYQIIHGDLVIQEEERLTVQNVFTTYLAGLSYQALADRMNADNIPFSQESPLWNKHKIKRMLENPRYAGENGYPSIIDQDTFQQVQNKIAEKATLVRGIFNAYFHRATSLLRFFFFLLTS